MTDSSIIFDPLLPWLVIVAATVLAFLFVGLAVWRRLKGWWLRGLAAAVLLLAIANPSYQQEDRNPLSDIVLLVVDETASQRIDIRPEQTEEAVSRITEAVEALPNTELRTVTVRDADDNQGSLVATALSELLAEEPSARVAGAIVVSDGQIHDVDRLPDLPAPLHLLLTGLDTDWDRRLIVKNAPAFAILDEEVMLTLRVEDAGRVPAEVASAADLSIAIDGSEPQTFRIPVGEDMEL
ncbi:MAG: hypothetical protein AAFY03_13540, partial [Pseudomonadota bacterium]